MPADGPLTPRQTRWFAAVRAGLETATGLSLAQWAERARACPEQGRRRQLAWMKSVHGLGQNHASIVLNAAFPERATWAEPETLGNTLWADPAQAALFAAVRNAAEALDTVVSTQRKAFSAFSRNVQFAAARPLRQGGIMVGLAVAPEADPRLVVRGRESWSERLSASMAVNDAHTIDTAFTALLRAAWERS